MKITQQERELRKERIIQTAFELFCKEGIEGVTLEQVAKKAGVGNTTIYRYFINKSLLVQETLSILWKSIGEKLEIGKTNVENYRQRTGRDQILIHLEDLRKLYLENREYILFAYEAKLYLVRNGVQLSQNEYDYLMFDIKQPCIEAINKGKKDGSIPSQCDSEDLFYTIWGCVRGYIVKIVLYGSLCPEDRMWESRYSILEDGIVCALASGWKISAAKN